MKILVVGPGRSGKDEACKYLAENTGLRFEGTTSLFLAEFVAEKKGCSFEEAYENRHNERQLWFDTGNEIRASDPLKLVRRALLKSDITGGIRDIAEIEACKKNNVFDLIIWIDRPGVQEDPTLKFGSEWADIVIQNSGTIEDFFDKLEKLSKIIRKAIL